ncbi:ATP-binding cassette domain-containing protein, partial [Candidatus Berkelbacteria bacterium]|nr:ATP-binding cassette domain-containing protein [Candidatus Berkelbacteria bacterium]
MPKTPVIKTTKLTKKFGQGLSEILALKGIDLEIFAGEYAILFGPSGCGKSTLLNIISGLEVPSTGEVYIRGEKLAGLSTDDLAYHRNTKIGIIFQQF